MVLSDLSLGQSAIVDEVELCDKVKDKLSSMGLTKGVKVTLVRLAPLGDPVEIFLRGFYLALRNSTAKNIKIKKL